MFFSIDEVKAAKIVNKEDHLDSLATLGTPPDFVLYDKLLHVKAQASLINSEIMVDAQVSTSMTFTCGRCLEIFKRPIKSSFKQIFTMDDQQIDLTVDLKEAVLLNLPLNFVCLEGCKGLCAFLLILLRQ